MERRNSGFLDEIIFPGDLRKAFTLSYDDGTIHDRRFIALLNKYRIKGTFNLNSGFFGLERKPKEGMFSRLDISVIDESEVPSLYAGHEVAGHGLTHVSPRDVGLSHAMYETITDKANLERITGKLIRGYAYPFGFYNEDVKNILRMAGYHYARAVEITHDFGIPEDFLEWQGTCRNVDPELMDLAKEFCESTGFLSFSKKLFYVWGHSYEFEGDQSWDQMEAFLKYMDEHREGIWFATNIEICEYVEAFRKLEYSADGDMVYNPTAVTVSLNRMGNTYTVKSGETVKLDLEPINKSF